MTSHFTKDLQTAVRSLCENFNEFANTTNICSFIIACSKLKKKCFVMHLEFKKWSITIHRFIFKWEFIRLRHPHEQNENHYNKVLN